MVIISQDNNEETDITMIEEDVGMFVPSSCSLNTRLSDAVGVTGVHIPVVCTHELCSTEYHEI